MSKNKSKYLSYLLRHKPEEAKLTMDPNGWVDINQIVNNTNLSKKDLYGIVESCDKQRYEFNDINTKIRARQGHSVKIDLGYKECEPQDYLYHGTAEKNFLSIFLDGLQKMGRHHVHLSPDEETAKKVGTRHGKPIVLKILAKTWWSYGANKFYKTENNVWLVDHVSPSHIQIYHEKYDDWRPLKGEMQIFI